MAEPTAVQSAFDALLEQVYREGVPDMDPQQVSDLRDFFFMGARVGYLAMVKGPTDAMTAELATFGKDFLRRLVQQSATLANLKPEGSA